MRLTKIVTLRHLVIDNTMQIGLEHRSDPVIQALVDTLPMIKFSEEHAMKYVSNNQTNIDRIMNIFRGIAWVNGKYFFRNRPISNDRDEENLDPLRNRSDEI